LKKSPQRKRARQRARPAAIERRAKAASRESLEWVRELAIPYLKGYRPIAAREKNLCGYWFVAPVKPKVAPSGKILTAGEKPFGSGPAAGFFVGYSLDEKEFLFLAPQPPEIIVFAWIHPAGKPLHRRLVAEPGSLVRKTFEYIRWLTHRPPRFVFHDEELPALARHQSIRDWPEEKRRHFSRNFFIETLAWLVRSGLVRKLAEEAAR
jgi:hypothetical protein